MPFLSKHRTKGKIRLYPRFVCVGEISGVSKMQETSLPRTHSISRLSNSSFLRAPLFSPAADHCRSSWLTVPLQNRKKPVSLQIHSVILKVINDDSCWLLQTLLFQPEGCAELRFER